MNGYLFASWEKRKADEMQRLERIDVVMARLLLEASGQQSLFEYNDRGEIVYG